MIKRKMRLVLLGPPGSGKGTQAQMICQKYHLPHISTGDIFRRNIAENTALGKKANDFISRGALVPDDLTIDLVRERLKEKDCENGFVLDGFPRNLSQAQALSQMTPIDKAIMISISDDVIIQRLSGRRICRKCAQPSHLKWLIDGRCEKCGGEVYVRDDDNPEIVKARLQKQKLPSEVIDFYKNQKVYVEAQTAEEKEVVFESIEKILKSLL